MMDVGTLVTLMIGFAQVCDVIDAVCNPPDDDSDDGDGDPVPVEAE